MASKVYGAAVELLLKNATTFKWDNATPTVKAILLNSSYTPNTNTHTAVSDVSAFKIAGTTDQTIGSRSIPARDQTNARVYLLGQATVTFTAVASGTCLGVALYRETAANAGDLICWNEFSSPVTANGSDIQVTFDSLGVASFTYGF